MRIKTLDLTPEIFVEFAKLCKDGPPRRIIVKENPLPDDAEIVEIRRRYVHAPHTLQLVIRSDSFADVPEGEEIPELPMVIFQTIYDECTERVA